MCVKESLNIYCNFYTCTPTHDRMQNKVRHILGHSSIPLARAHKCTGTHAIHRLLVLFTGTLLKRTTLPPSFSFFFFLLSKAHTLPVIWFRSNNAGSSSSKKKVLARPHECNLKNSNSIVSLFLPRSTF